MRNLQISSLLLTFSFLSYGQHLSIQGDSLRMKGLLMPALEKYAMEFNMGPSKDISHKIATTAALLWTEQVRDIAFFFLNFALEGDSTLKVLYDPDFLSLIDDPRWLKIEEQQFRSCRSSLGYKSLII